MILEWIITAAVAVMVLCIAIMSDLILRCLRLLAKRLDRLEELMQLPFAQRLSALRSKDKHYGG